MTVATLQSTMSSDEYVRWCMFYARKAQQEELERLKAKG